MAFVHHMYTPGAAQGLRMANKRRGSPYRRGQYARRRRTRGRYEGATRREHKFFDTVIDDAVIATSAQITASVHLLPDGTLDGERIGRKSVIRQLQWRYQITLPSSTDKTLTSDTVVLIVFLDKQCNGLSINATTLLEEDNFQSFNRIENKDRMKILMRRTYDLQANSGGGNGTANDFGEMTIHGEFFKKVNVPIQFSGATGAITEIKSNNIGVLVISSTGISALTSVFRVRFTDN